MPSATGIMCYFQVFYNLLSLNSIFPLPSKRGNLWICFSCYFSGFTDYTETNICVSHANMHIYTYLNPHPSYGYPPCGRPQGNPLPPAGLPTLFQSFWCQCNCQDCHLPGCLPLPWQLKPHAQQLLNILYIPQCWSWVAQWVVRQIFSSWRGVRMLSTPGKLFGSILLERLKNSIDTWHRDE